MASLLHHQKVRTHASQIWKFAIAGGTGSLIDLGSLAIFVQYFGINPNVAFIPSTLLAVIVVFLINKHFTFKNKEKRYASQAMKFAMVYGVAILVNIFMSTGFNWIGTQLFAGILPVVVIALCAKAGAIGIGAIWNYTLSHGFVFKKREEAEPVIV